MSRTVVASRLHIFIDSISIQPAASSIPIRIELVTFPPQTLLASDFDRTIQPALAFTTIIPQISRTDISRNVTVDVTSLMVEAQRRGLADFQVRILEDDGFVFTGLIEIDATDKLTAMVEEQHEPAALIFEHGLVGNFGDIKN